MLVINLLRLAVIDIQEFSSKTLHLLMRGERLAVLQSIKGNQVNLVNC